MSTSQALAIAMPTVASVLRWGTAPGTLVASSALVFTASQAAFTATTANGPDTWSAGTVAISDDDDGSATFTATVLGTQSAVPATVTTATALSWAPSATALDAAGNACTITAATEPAPSDANF